MSAFEMVDASTGELVPYVEPARSTTLFRSDDPNEIVVQASQTAKVLAEVVKSCQLTVSIQGRDHVKVEGWTLLGTMLGVFPVCVWTRELVRDGQPNGWEARVEARTRDGAIVGAAEAQCTRDENQWSWAPVGRNGQKLQPRDDYALRSMAQCVPVRAEILTRHGFRPFYDVLMGEDVLAYDCESDTTTWTPLRGISVYADQPVVRLHSRSLDVTVTSEHSWPIRQYRTTKRVPFQHLVPTSELGGFARTYTNALVLAAPASGGKSKLTPEEAAIIGWLITDGSIGQPQRGFLRAHIDQSKQMYVTEIRELIGARASEAVTQQPPRTFPTGRIYATQPAHRFAIKAGSLRELFSRAGISGREDCPALATRLSNPARAAMLDAMLKADGAQRRDGGRTGRTWVFGQKDPAVLETFHVLAALEGHGLGRPQYDAEHPGFVRQVLRSNRHIQLRAIRNEEAGREDVWCPTTDFGTWVMRLDGQVLVTGNTRSTSKALRQPLGFVMQMAGFEATPAEEMTGVKPEPAAPTVALASKSQKDHIHRLIDKLEKEQVLAETAIREGMQQAYGTQITTKLTKEQASDLIERLKLKAGE